MRSEDLAPLLADKGLPGVGFRQGKVVSFNANTGANTIDVAGTALVDVPMLNSGEAVALKAGHVVGLLTFKSSWWILGRVTVPNSAQFASASVAFGGARDTVNGNTIVTGVPGVIETDAEIPVPAWADEAIVMATADATGDNTSAQNDDAFFVYAQINGVNGHENMAQVPSGKQAACSASMELLITGASLGSTINVGCGVRTNIQTWSGGNNRAAINAIAVFRSTS